MHLLDLLLLLLLPGVLGLLQVLVRIAQVLAADLGGGREGWWAFPWQAFSAPLCIVQPCMSSKPTGMQADDPAACVPK